MTLEILGAFALYFLIIDYYPSRIIKYTFKRQFIEFLLVVKSNTFRIVFQSLNEISSVLRSKICKKAKMGRGGETPIYDFGLDF